MPLTCGARSTVNIDRSTVNQVGSRLGFGGPGQGWIWAGLSPPRGLVSECHVAFWVSGRARVHSSRYMVDSGAMVHGPQAGLRWTASTLLFSLCGPRAPGACACGRRGKPSVSIPSMLPPVVSSPASSHSGASAQLRWEKASLGLGEYGGGVKVATRASQGFGHGGRWLGVAVLTGGASRGSSRGPGARFSFRRLAGGRM